MIRVLLLNLFYGEYCATDIFAAIYQKTGETDTTGTCLIKSAVYIVPVLLLFK
jgi:hypothetical protein